MSAAIHHRRGRLAIALTGSLALHGVLLLLLAIDEPKQGSVGGTGGAVAVSIVAAPPPLSLGAGDAPTPKTTQPSSPPTRDTEREPPTNTIDERDERDMRDEPSARGDPAGEVGGVAEGSVGGLPGGVVGGVVGGEPGGGLGGDDRISGTMIVRCVVATDGALENCRVVRPLPHVSEAVMDALKTWKLPPPTSRDQPNAVDRVISVRLLLPDR